MTLKATVPFGLLLARSAHAGCADQSDACKTDLGSYHIRLPDAAEGAGEVLFLHGYGSHGGNTIGKDHIVAPALAHGYAGIASKGIPTAGGRPNG